MRYLVFLISLLLLSVNIHGQTVEGKVFDSIAVVKDMKVLNKTQNRLTVTDQDGNFSIVARVNDTLTFNSIFYHPLKVVLKPYHFEDISIFEVKKVTSQLDEVNIKAAPEQPVFKEETYNEELHNLIKEDIKRNPHLYSAPNAQYGLDFIYLFKQITKLFKRKKPKKEEETFITYKQLSALIENHSFFNSQLITKDLKIPEEHKFLFLEFCAAKGISSDLLKEKHRMMLLEKFVVNSQLFLIILEEYGEENVKKD